MTDTVTRQTLYDLVANAAHDAITQTDLNDDLSVTFVSGSPPVTTKPGQLWFDSTDQVMKVFTDMIEGTGCSLYLAFGPDRFDVALLADEPIPFGAAVVLTGAGRRAHLPPTPHALSALQSDLQWEVAKVVGFNQQGQAQNHDTAASGTWFAAAVEGYCWCWYPVNRNLAGTWRSSEGSTGDQYDSLIFTATDITALSGISDVRGGIVADQRAHLSGQARTPFLVQSLTALDANNTNWTRRVFYGARLGRPT